jgi:hypothetical protein
MLSRADANGLLVDRNRRQGGCQGTGHRRGDAVLKVTYGKDLMEFHAELDARTQYTAAKAVSWDMKTQAVPSPAPRPAPQRSTNRAT